MDIDSLESSIKTIIKDHKEAFIQIGASQPKLLELSSLTGIAQHYQSNNFTVEVVNPKGKKGLQIKTSTQGFPWNFSRIHLHKGSESAEIHMNLKVRSAQDEGIYCIDVGVAQSGKVPESRPKSEWICLSNEHLITFAEAKKLNIYPMLLAQFIGIVHEIKPEFLASKDPSQGHHLPPTLISLGHFSGNSSQIVKSYPGRGVRVFIAENYDIRLAKVRKKDESSPFYQSTQA